MLVFNRDRPVRRATSSATAAPYFRSTAWNNRAMRSQPLGRRVRLREIVEEAEERVVGPLRRQSKQVQQIPYFDGMHLHGRGSQQNEPRGSLPESLHEAQECVGAALTGGTCRTPARMMRLVEHDQVPRFGILQEHCGSIAAPQQVAGRDHDRFAVPLAGLDLTLVR